MAADLLALLLKAALASGLATLVIIALRKAARRLAGAEVAYTLWLLVPLAALALLVPPRTVQVETAPERAAISSSQIQTRATATLAVTSSPTSTTSALPGVTVLALTIWGAGAAGLIGVQFYRQRRFTRRAGPLSPVEGGVWRAAGPQVGPLLVGVLRPRILVPSDFERRFSPEARDLILLHEHIHRRRGDVAVNAAALLLQGLFWFNPLIHLGARLMRLDQELACDARVAAERPGSRKAYAEAMLKAQADGTTLAAPLACAWPARSALAERIAWLSRGAPSNTARRAGAAAAVLLALSGSVAAWAAQPPREVTADRDAASPAARALGGELIDALIEGRFDEAYALIGQGADVNRARLGDGSPLILSARTGRPDLVRALLAAGADPNLAVSGDGSPLIQAAAGGDLDSVNLLLAAGAGVDQIVPSDETALINAAREGKMPVVQRLIEAGADPNLAVMAPRFNGDMERRSPLSMAEREGHADVAAYLRAQGARA
ncbi:M56 family metallopeptidase [Brevundimonas sp. 2R-24]|uniref:M56 family metallopeptidase n=1 Tax=Peiella sedimenti TaxID=3061083 RepID=A0ABT8SNH1_9CAUL|nr:M56 family metallopeptidase [Caulobacteraceae bacterium XZ-24]